MDWDIFKIFETHASADILADHLNAEGIPTQVIAEKLEAGLESEFQVLVPSELVHRARWVLANSEFTDNELNFIATGELPIDKE